MELSPEDTGQVAVIEFSEGDIKQEVQDEDTEANEEAIEEIHIEKITSNSNEIQIPRENIPPRINIAMPSGVNVVIINGIKIVKVRDSRTVISSLDSRPGLI